MNVKKIVKVMNFHALLRVDAARNKADTYMILESELSAMIDIVLNNKNLQLDKKIMKPKKGLPKLNIYIGSDYGFCGGINSVINHKLIDDKENNLKVSVGKKLRQLEDTHLHVSHEDFPKYEEEINELLYDAVHNRKYSSINLIYNHYYNMSTITPVTACIYPLEKKKKNSSRYAGDFTIEGNVETLLEKMIMSYLNYKIDIAYVNAYASENIIRQNATRQSLTKIEEKEEEELMIARREKNQKSFGKVIDSYVKKKSMGGGFQK